MSSGQQLPQTAPGFAQLGQQLRRDLADRLRLTCEFGQIMAINYAAATESYPRMDDAFTHADQANLLHADERGGAQPGPARRRRVPGSFDPDERTRADLNHNWFAYLERRGRQEQKLWPLFVP